MSPSQVEVRSPLAGLVVRTADLGDHVARGGTVAVVESMKMEHVVEAPAAGAVVAVLVDVGDEVAAGDLVAVVDVAAPAADPSGGLPDPPPGRPAGDGPHGGDPLAEVVERHRRVTDAARPDAVASRHGRGRRTARENVDHLLDPGSFVEYGPLLVAAQRSRRSIDELVERTPADGLVAGFGQVGGRDVAVLAYDYTVLAGTQGYWNHHKKDRIFELIERRRVPAVLFAEGGGGRPGDVDAPQVAGLDTRAFEYWARLSGRVPLVGVASGRCFAGNAALLGCCDVIVATPGTNIGMGGPAMIEGGGLGVVTPDEIGPLDDQVRNGVVDLVADDEADAVGLVRRYLGVVGGAEPSWTRAPDDTLRRVIPANRREAYDIRTVVAAIADEGSVLELRAGFAPAMVTAFVRVEGRSLGVVANNPRHGAGAIDRDAADKAAAFLDRCEQYRIPVLFLCDTPGIMVGPEAERAGTVRSAGRLFTSGARLTVAFGTIVVRRGYGLGAQAMAGGSFKAGRFCVAWPTGELGGMGLEGAVRLGFRRELDAIADDAERQAAFDAMVARAYERGRALNVATYFEIDDVIDPADSRRWIRTLFTDHPT